MAQPFLNVIPCLAFYEEYFVGLPVEGLHCLQEIYDVPKIFLEVLTKEPIYDVKYSLISLIIELNVKVLRHLPFFLFFLVGIILPSGIDVFEEFDESVYVRGLFKELQQDVLDVLGREPLLDVRVRVINILSVLILIDNLENETLDDLNNPEQGFVIHL